MRNKTNLLQVNFTDWDNSANMPSIVGVDDASVLVNSPVTSGTFIATWDYYPLANIWGVVVMREIYPISGRVWQNIYNGGWSGWKSIVLT